MERRWWAVRALCLVALLVILPGVASAMGVAPAGSNHQARKLTSCLRDAIGAGTLGSIDTSTEVFLKLASINESDWSSSPPPTADGYYERRYDSGFNVTYFNENDFGGSDRYGTAGNVNRMTSIQPTVSTLPTWSESESGIC